MGLNAKQKQAVEYLDGPLLVLAGPGTGKTQLLSEKVAYILKNTDTNPENILCMSFTETGALNMRERLKSIIGKDGMKVNINTYHAFGSDILAQYRNYADEYDRRLDAAIDEVTQYKIVKSIQDGLNGRDILRGDAVKDIIAVISAAKSAGLTAEELNMIAEQNIADSKVLSETISPLLKNIVPRAFRESYDNAYSPIYEVLKNYQDATVINLNGARSDDSSPRFERIISLLARDLKDAVLEAEGTEKIKPLSAWKDKYFEKDNKGDYRLKDIVANKKLLSLANVMKKYDTYLQENGLFDFDDMIEEAVRVLKTDAGFKATLSERYQFIMLDEFQDTNPSQFAIIKELTDYEKPLIMAVGDDDQAIYEFQGALSTNLTDFQAHYAAEVIALVENYRSTQEVLDFAHEIIKQAPDRFADKELIAHRENPKKSQIFRHEFLTSDMEYGFVAEEIARLIKSGVPQNEIAIISYKTKYFMPLLPYLKAQPTINVAYEKKNDLFEDTKIHEIFTVMRLIYEIANNQRVTVPVLEVFTYTWLGLPVVEMIKIVDLAKREKRSVFDVMSACENAEIKEVVEWFSEMVAKSFNEPLEVMLGYLLERMRVNELGDYERFKLYENLAALTGRLKRHFGDKSLRLSDLIQMLDDYEAADMPLTVNSPYREAEEAVSVLSAHKAKGLEFSYVFIIAADHTAWGKGKGNNNMLSLPKNLAQIRHTGTTDGEKLRILYVALTRAKQGLYITNSLRDFNGKSPDRLEYLDEYAEGDKVISSFLPDREVKLHYEASAYEFAENNLKNWLKPYIHPTPDLRLIYQERAKRWRMSASALTAFIDIVYAGPEAFFKSYILQAPREPETEALAYGDLVHQTFERVTNGGISDEEAIEYFLSELEQKDLPIEIAGKLRERGPADLKVALITFGEILRQGKAEVDLGSEKLSIEGIPVTGKIDHMLIDDDTKTIEIYDFKTGNYHKEKWQSHATLYKYMLQLGFYKLLLNNSPTYAKYKVTKAHILFVKPDIKDGEVYDKIYEFDKEEEQTLLALMKAVYQLVLSLDFFFYFEIMIKADDKLGIKDIRRFIELLLAKADKK